MMVEQAVLEERKMKNKLIVSFGIITEAEAEDYVDAIGRVTNVELRALEQEHRGLTELIGYVEAERKIHLMKIEYYMAKQALGIMGLTKEQACELGRMMREELMGR
jgi:hypothetical protein